ncbi:SOH1-domain-containing protein [Nadsonia fulvescens var. elongata DSM 6958]|uniref:Mediator of RNA polymerase II transcription subunit 31 n=1 Tax=Nadsonia fulvescens var. elongata DSM 6958 TaxID=857566 RepID=A0A1E3PFH0_9ASCO|nr:SOH1-domain-containing protein [Nadsonia fulvescens var. elongata DSM 6958]
MSEPSTVDHQLSEEPTRWEIELEFVQSLANPMYLNYLAQMKYLEDEQFLAYLEYLAYWQKPEFSKYLIYPNCLHILRLLRYPMFRQEILRADVAKLFMDEFYMKWLKMGAVGTDDSISEDISPEAKKAKDVKGEAGNSVENERNTLDVKLENGGNGVV